MEPLPAQAAAPTAQEGAGFPPADQLDRARRAGFRALLALLERTLGPGAQVGTAAAPGEERLRFRHDPALEFSTSDVPAVRLRELPGDPGDFTSSSRQVLEITTAFLGLTGAVSPLPGYLAEEVVQEDPDKPHLREFLDLFHHRVLSLFRRAQARCDYPATFRTDGADAWSRRVLALLGVDAPPGAPAPASAWRLLRLAPFLAERSLTAEAVAAALEDGLAEHLDGAPVQVEQFAGAWVEVAPAERCQLGRSGSRLGQDLLLGRRIFDRAGKFRVVVGPLSREGFERATGAPAVLRTVKDILVALTAEPLDCEVQLALRADAAPRLQLSARGPARLGRNTWLGGQTQRTRITVELPA
ncbi:MAG: type VI secretion system baseplate subunit TssG [Deltaproteobacteria bacterium]|nr:type VI secretion system baseplate subunit TssG [Deltaproteobacteria bacterium]